MFNLNANHLPGLAKIEDDVLRYLLCIRTRNLSELNVQRIRVRKVLESHGIYFGCRLQIPDATGVATTASMSWLSTSFATITP